MVVSNTRTHIVCSCMHSTEGGKIPKVNSMADLHAKGRVGGFSGESLVVVKHLLPSILEKCYKKESFDYPGKRKRSFRHGLTRGFLIYWSPFLNFHSFHAMMLHIQLFPPTRINRLNFANY